MIKFLVSFFLFLSFSLLFSSFIEVKHLSIVYPSKQNLIRTIIIDAGHGGKDVGAKGAISYEKNICLAIAKELQKTLKKNLPEVKLVMTRDNDTYPELHARADLANKHKGDLFISIHVNAAPAISHSEIVGYKNVTSYSGKGKKRKKIVTKVPKYRHWTTPNPAKGPETYIWGAHKNEDKEVALRENGSMLLEDNFKKKYGDINPNSPEFVALSLVKTKQYFRRSTSLAGFVQDEFAKIGRNNREVRQRAVGLWVLQATAMPGILVETGYISNPSEEKYLNSKNGQLEMAQAIARALKTYISWLEKQQLDNNKTQITFSAEQFLTAIDKKEKSRL